MVSEVLQRPTLVLNKSWQPVNVATVARALVMVWSDTARGRRPVGFSALRLDGLGSFSTDG